MGLDTYVYNYIGATGDGIDTITTETGADENIIRIYVDDPVAATWGFQRHDIDNVRLVLNVFDAANYIVLNREDIVGDRFELKISDLAETAATMQSFDKVAIKTAFEAYESSIPPNFVYDSSADTNNPNVESVAVPPVSAGDYIIDLSAASIAGFDAFTTLDSLLASGRIAFFRTGTDGADLKIVFVNDDGSLDRANSLTFTGAYDDATGMPTAAFEALPVVFRAASGRVSSSNFGTDLADATDTTGSALVIDDTFADFFIDGATQANFKSLLGSDKTLEVTSIDDVLLAVVRIGTDLYRTYTLRDVPIVTGGNQADTFTGNAQANTFQGGAGVDTLDGGAGNDILEGGDGNDTLTGGLGNDILQGGGGEDTYVFTGDSGSDTITEAAETGIKTILLFKDLLDTTDPLNPWQDRFDFTLSSADDLTITFTQGSSSSIVTVENYAQETLEFRYGAGGTADTLNIVLGTVGGGDAEATTEVEHFVGFAAADTVSYANSISEAVEVDLFGDRLSTTQARWLREIPSTALRTSSARITSTIAATPWIRATNSRATTRTTTLTWRRRRTIR